MDCDRQCRILQPGRLSTYISDAIWLNHLQLDGHASNGGIWHISPIHQGDAVHETKCQDQPEVDFALDTLVVGWGELVEDGVAVAMLAFFA